MAGTRSNKFAALKTEDAPRKAIPAMGRFLIIHPEATSIPKPIHRVRLICHHITRPDRPQNIIDTNIMSTAMAQNQRALDCTGYP